MKRKMSIILNIATLCLCVCAIAIGVYSAKNASVNINGTIGFVANNCNATVTAEIYGDAIDTTNNNTPSSSGTSRREWKAFTPVNINGTDGSLDLDDIYFCDMRTVNGKPAPIKLRFTIQNTSNFAIKASITLPALSGVTAIANKESIRIEKDSEGEIQITLTVNENKIQTGLEPTGVSLSGTTITLNDYYFTKSQIPVKKETLSSGTEMYYIEYGYKEYVSTGSICWYIMGKTNASGQLVSLDASDIEQNGVNNYKMKDNITYALISKSYIPVFAQKQTVCFNKNNIFEYKGWNAEWSSVLANDYSVSDVRKYLNGYYSVYKYVDENDNGYEYTSGSFLYGNCLTGNHSYSSVPELTSDIYTLIKPRTLNDLYVNINATWSGSYDFSSLDLPQAGVQTEGVLGTDSDAFWLISASEYGFTTSANLTAMGLGDVHTRSPFLNSSDGEGYQYVIGNSDFISGSGNYANSVSQDNLKVFPAFLI